MNGLFKKVFCVILILVSFSCSQQFRNHGYIPSEEELSIVSVSEDDKDSVIQKLGTPSIGFKALMEFFKTLVWTK